MNTKILALLTMTLMAEPMCANAQITNLEYQSSALTGSTSYYNNPIPPELLTPQQFAASFSTAPFIGSLSDSLRVISSDGMEIGRAHV